jgi:protein FAM50
MAQYKGAASEGSRAMQLQKRREKEHQEAEFRMNKLKEELRVDKMENKFAVHYDAVEAQLKVLLRMRWTYNYYRLDKDERFV